MNFVDVTSIELTYPTTFVYLESEQLYKFFWTLEKSKEIFITKSLFPHVIVSDKDISLMKVVEVVFSQVVNLLCGFYIDKNVGGNIVSDKVKEI